VVIPQKGRECLLGMLVSTGWNNKTSPGSVRIQVVIRSHILLRCVSPHTAPSSLLDPPAVPLDRTSKGAGPLFGARFGTQSY